MPELPEIETVKMQLHKVLVGQKLVRVIVKSNRTVKSDLGILIGKRVTGIERMGKVLLIVFSPSTSSGRALRLGFHFKMTGQLIYDENLHITNNKIQNRIVGGHPTGDFVNKLPSSHTRVIFYFNKGTLYFNDQRKFGWIELNPKFTERLGPEPFEISATDFVTRIQKTKRPVKLAIMDQEIISGVGNIYANDALWESNINPQSPSNKIQTRDLILLFEKLKLVLSEGIKFGGATAVDAKYINLHGLGGHYQEHFRVYDREGQKCLRNDKGIVKKFVLGGRGTYFCPVCQE